MGGGEVTTPLSPDNMTEVNVTLRWLEQPKRISNVVYDGRTDNGPFRVFFPTKDRRKARRIARRLKIRFSRGPDGYMVWK